MHIAYLLLFITGTYPFYRAWRANKQTTLAHAVAWALLAWLAWGMAFLLGDPYRPGMEGWRFGALCLTAAAGIAVLGARRPQAGAWNLVIVGLLAVMLLPMGESFVLKAPAMTWPRIVFLAGTLTVGVLNYLPTRMALAALWLAGSTALEGASLFCDGCAIAPSALSVGHVSLLLLPWVALACWRQAPAKTGLAVNRLWHGFRDRYGVFWAQRVREQYNRSAAHAGLPGYLYWRGWKASRTNTGPPDDQLASMEALLASLLQRFDAETPARGELHKPEA